MSSLLIPVDIEMESPYMKFVAPVLTIFGIIVNVVALVKIMLDKRLHTPTYLVVGALIVGDLASVGLHLIHQMLHLSSEMDTNKTERIFMIFSYGTTHVSASHVVFLLGLRYYSVVRPIRYDLLSHKDLIKISCGLWIASICFACIYYIFRFETSASLPVVVFMFRGYLLCLPIAFIIYFHFKKIKELKKSTRTLISESFKEQRTSRVKDQIQVMSKMIVVIVVVFTISATLYPMAFSLIYFGVCCTEIQCIGMIFAARIAWLVKYSVNPIIYLLFSKSVYKRIKKSVNKYYKLYFDDSETQV